MTPEQKAAYIFSQAIAAQIHLESMKAENYDRECQGHSHAWGPENFMELQDNYCITHDRVMEFLIHG